MKRLRKITLGERETAGQGVAQIEASVDAPPKLVVSLKKCACNASEMLCMFEML